MGNCSNARTRVHVHQRPRQKEKVKGDAGVSEGDAAGITYKSWWRSGLTAGSPGRNKPSTGQAEPPPIIKASLWWGGEGQSAAALASLLSQLTRQRGLFCPDIAAF